MKKTALYAALFAFTCPMSLYAMGLGEMTVTSALDQPFKAEIELIDVGSAPLTTIKVGIADTVNFERIGIVPVASLALLRFTLGKNNSGKPVIIIDSVERMTEPYMELIVDLAWPNGQLYKAYTVLLDPPGYDLVSTKASGHLTRYRHTAGSHHEAGVIDKTVVSTVDYSSMESKGHKSKSTYGPTVSNENVWQIAQRYKTADLILPQIVLALVGANPEAFKDGNLNGLKVGVRLSVPRTKDIQGIPADMATQEVMAHDKAWNEKTPINHLMPPPYLANQPLATHGNIQPSELPVVPYFPKQTAVSLPSMPQLINAISFVQTDKNPAATEAKNPLNKEQEANTRAEIAITTAAIDSVRESNALLMEQFRLLQKQNQALQTRLDKRDKEFDQLRKQLLVTQKERVALAAQVSSSSEHTSFMGGWFLLLLLLIGGGGAGSAYWYYQRREEKEGSILKAGPNSIHSEPVTEVAEPAIEVVEPVTEVAEPVTEVVEPVVEVVEPVVEVVEPVVEVVEPAVEVAEPVVEVVEPAVEVAEPAVEVAEPAVEVIEPAVEVVEPAVEFEEPSQPANQESDIEPKKTLSMIFEPFDKAPIKEVHHEGMIEFEPGLHHALEEKPLEETEIIPEKKLPDVDDSIPFISNLSLDDLQDAPTASNVSGEASGDLIFDEISLETPAEDDSLELLSTEPEEHDISGDLEIHTDDLPANPLKSQKALDTLISLAKTYISMEDYDSAKQSLEEVIEHGSEVQKKQANQLLDEIKDK